MVENIQLNIENLKQNSDMNKRIESLVPLNEVIYAATTNEKAL